MLALTELTPSTFIRLKGIERNPNAEPWETTVEQILLDGIAADHLNEPGAVVLAADDDGRIVGAAFHYPHEKLPGAQYIAAVLVDWRYRQLGHGRDLMTQTIAHAHETSGRPYVVWAVDFHNDAMIGLSEELGTSF